MIRLSYALCVTALLGPMTLTRQARAEPQPVGKTAEGKLTDEMKKFQGLWQVTKLVPFTEKPLPADEIAGATFEFKGNTVGISRRKNTPAAEFSKFAVDPAKTPKAIDIFFLGEDNKPSECIYKFDGDELTICIHGGALGGKIAPRPTEFKASKRDFYALYVMKRVKK